MCTAADILWVQLLNEELRSDGEIFIQLSIRNLPANQPALFTSTHKVCNAAKTFFVKSYTLLYGHKISRVVLFSLFSR